MLSSSHSEYKAALGILADCSEHITLISNAVIKNILPKIVTRCSMIDVGAGIGILTKHLSQYFQHTTVLDVNPEVENALRSCGFNEVKICDFFKFETDKKYDFVLCSHVMYHFDAAQMTLFIEKLRSCATRQEP